MPDLTYCGVTGKGHELEPRSWTLFVAPGWPLELQITESILTSSNRKGFIKGTASWESLERLKRDTRLSFQKGLPNCIVKWGHHESCCLWYNQEGVATTAVSKSPATSATFSTPKTMLGALSFSWNTALNQSSDWLNLNCIQNPSCKGVWKMSFCSFPASVVQKVQR